MWTLSWQVITDQKQIVEPCDTRLIVNNTIHVVTITNMPCRETVWGLLLGTLFHFDA